MSKGSHGRTGTGGWFASFGWSKNASGSQSNPLPSRKNKLKNKDNNNNNKNILKTDEFRRKRKQEQNAADDLRIHSMVMGLSIDQHLRKQIIEEQKTRKLTLEREKKKQNKLRKLKEEKRIFDIGLIINNNNEYDKILCGPITYQIFYHYIRFINCQNYIRNDINILQKCTIFSEEILSSDINEFFCNYSEKHTQNGVNFKFSDILKVQLFKFKDNETKQMWINHKNKQTKLHCDIFIIVNKENIPLYVFLNVDIDLIEEEIKFDTYHEYQTGDIKKLKNLGQEINNFQLTSTFSYFKKESFHLFPHNFSNEIHQTLKHGICYNFKNILDKNKFFKQKYEIAIITNDNDEMLYVLNDILYNLRDGGLSYKSSQIYRNKDYQKLKEFGQQIKSVKVNGYYKNNNSMCFEWNKCILFNINNKQNYNLWLKYIENQKNSKYDIAIITDLNDYQCYILNDVKINWIDQIIEFKHCDPFKSNHNKLIQHYGQFIISDKFQQFKSSSLNYYIDSNKTYKNILFYQLKSHGHNTFKQGIETTHNIHGQNVDDQKEDIFRVYVSRNGFPPKNPHQLHEFAKLQIKVDDITFTKAEEIFNQNVSTPHKNKKPKLMNLGKRDSITPASHGINGVQQIVPITKIDDKGMFPDCEKSDEFMANNVTNSDDKLDGVWNAYLKQYGFEPANAQQLKVFSGVTDGVKNLSYMEARDLFKKRCGGK